MGRRLADAVPVAVFGDLKAMLISEVRAVGGDHLSIFFVPHIADALEKQERQNVTLPVGAVHGAAAQDIRRLPEVGFELGESYGLGHGSMDDPLWLYCTKSRRRSHLHRRAEGVVYSVAAVQLPWLRSRCGQNALEHFCCLHNLV